MRVILAVLVPDPERPWLTAGPEHAVVPGRHRTLCGLAVPRLTLHPGQAFPQTGSGASCEGCCERLHHLRHAAEIDFSTTPDGPPTTGCVA